MQEINKVSVGAEIVSTKRDVKSPAGLEFKLQQNLVYLGQNGISFSIGYREYDDGSARTPFNENVHYQNPSTDSFTEIAFRSVRLKVHSVSNLEIEFEIVELKDRI
jgi:hypothetical protein